MITFLFIELFGLIRNEPIESILLKSLGAFIVFIILGNIICAFVDPVTKDKAGDASKPQAAKGEKLDVKVGAAAAPSANPAQGQEPALEAMKRETLELAREKPKEMAKAVEAMISK